MNNIELKAIEDIMNMSFYIPNYQRGYRWTSIQVSDLLDDIAEFYANGAKGIYCVQPLVVVGRNDEDILKQIKEGAKDINDVKRFLSGKWEVVDGQQRLTTIKLILQELGIPSYSIEYETREYSKTYLEKGEGDYNNNIDFYHIWNAKNTIHQWFEEHPNLDRAEFENVLLKQVKFIWYETKDSNPKEVFTRLNIGKISLTNAELVKALLLNKTNFNQHINDEIYIKALQQEIAMQWDAIEADLQNREFWMFLNNIGDDRSTRIELIFSLMAENDMLSCGNNEGLYKKDDYYTFRYFYRYMAKEVGRGASKSAIIKTIWDQVMEIYLTLKEWYDDMELYHYIGFLIYCKDKPKYLYTLYKNWSASNSKSDFKEECLKAEIKNCLKTPDIDNTIYDTKEGGPKHNCFSILLLHNVQTIIDRNRVLLKNEKYSAGVFYKFPFHICKSEGWDIEHIDSNTTNGLNDIRTQREWLLNAYFGLVEDKDKSIREEIKKFFKDYPIDQENVNKKERDEEFEELRKQIEGDELDNTLRLTQEEKNKIWNFVLLDASTNRSYGNAIYPAKRRVILGKEQGNKYATPTINEEGEIVIKAEEGQSSFIPPCTKNVFLKYYDTKAFDPYSWTRDDAEAYLENIKETLKPFLS